MTDGTMQCSSCGLTIEELRKSAAIHCAHCPTSFRTELILMLRRLGLHGGYAGLVPGETLTEHADLHTALSQALQADDFESAVIIRERLRRLKNNESGQ
jgi:protein-arginine kinase activator protein McsA